MATAIVIYEGDLRTTATHIASDNTIITDAPVDNHGKGEAFSPTDLVSSALASCMLTIMGIAARTHQLDIVGTKAEVTKVMQAQPRRIAAIQVDITFPHHKYTEKERLLLERAARTCPVALSLHPDIDQQLAFIYPETL